MKKHLSTILIILIFCIGLSLLLYPAVSDYWNSLHQSRAIASYADTVAEMDEDTSKQIWENAQAYNAALAERGNTWNLTEEEKREYESQLDITGTGIMGYIEIPKIGCSLPIYHGTDEAILQIAVGHLEGSSLPVGGESSHCLLSGHRGLPRAKLFTDIDKLVEGDTFVLRTLDETLTYEVDRILIVLPHELEALNIEEGKDLCTLITCTPYGVNSHRILVRGHWIENQKDAAQAKVTADATQVEPLMVAPVAASPILLLMLLGVSVRIRKRIHKKKSRRKG